MGLAASRVRAMVCFFLFSCFLSFRESIFRFVRHGLSRKVPPPMSRQRWRRLEVTRCEHRLRHHLLVLSDGSSARATDFFSSSSFALWAIPPLFCLFDKVRSFAERQLL